MSKLINAALKSLSINTKMPEANQTSSKRIEGRLFVNEHDYKMDGSSDGSSFLLWKDAMKMVARLPDGIPPEFRKQLWLNLAKRHIENKKIKFKEILPFCFSEENDPSDTELGTQIIKDLHRTGCSLFSGDVAELNQTHLKKVLLGYARWNPGVGYCQGFNMLAAIILEVVDWLEEDALMVMIFLIEEVLPESYFANHLRGLSVDMAVFRDLLRMRLTTLSSHLDKLQASTQDSSTGQIYEPPLTNVFTMQWFLTLFTNCLPKDTVLRVWDLILLEGNEVLLRTALTIWDGLADRIMAVESADEFYSIMGVLTREILEFGLMDANAFLKTVCTLAPFPFPQLQELRDSYAYNIQPFTSWSSDSEFQIFSADGDYDDDDDDDDMSAAKWHFSNELQWSKKRGIANSSVFNSIGPGAYGSSENNFPLSFTNFNTERMTLDISSLKKQYLKLRERQKQAHVILSGAFQNHFQNCRRNSLAVNHLLMGKQPLTRKKSHQKHLKFTEKKAAKKKELSPTGSHLLESVEDRNQERESMVVKATEHGVLHVQSITETASNFGCCADQNSQENCDKTNAADKCDALLSLRRNSPWAESSCSCSLSFTCLAHVNDAFSEKPQSINPFPTKRRVGSMKNKAGTQ